VTVEIGMMHWAGLIELTGKDYTPIALYNYGAAGIQVRTDSEWNTTGDFVNAVKADPGKYKGSGTGQGGSWHLALAGMLNDAGIATDAAPWVPSKGSAAGLQELVVGGVDVVTSSVVEASTLIGASKVKSLAVIGWMIFYILVSAALGFIPTSLLILTLLLIRFGSSLRASILVAFATTFVIHTLFAKVLLVPLPWGILPPVAW
jgi:hypothetical protein